MRISTGAVLGLFLLAGAPVFAQRKPQPIKVPDDVTFRTATIISEGTRMAAEIFTPKSKKESEKLPTILMAHGWGGTAWGLRPDGIKFAQAGYLVVVFDYRGWGNSDGRVILSKPAPADSTGGTFTAEVSEVREVVDPLDQTTDWLNALHWLHGEKACDTKRIGLWGSSYSGGHVVYVAAHDLRVKAIFSQVGSMDSRFVIMNGVQRAITYKQGTARTRGELGYPKPGAKELGNLKGAPVRERLMHYAPIEHIDKLANTATMFVIAEKEELFDNRHHGIKAHALAKGPKKLVTVPKITHYGIYREARKQAQQMAIDWFNEHLKK